MKKKQNIGKNCAPALVAVFAALLAGCQSISPGWNDSVQAQVEDSLQRANTAGKEGKPVPADVNKALLPPIEISLPEGKTTPLEPRFDLSVNNASARQVFMGLVEGTQYSMVLQPDVRGSFSLNLKEVTVPEAINAIRQAYGYEYRREGNRFIILGREMQTRLFPVNYLNLTRKGNSDTRVSASGLTSTGTAATGGTTAAASSLNSGVQVQTQSQSDFWKDIGATLSAIIGTEGGRKVVVNPQIGIIVVRAMPDEMRLVEDFLGVTQASLNRQVIIEAKILEVNLNEGFQSGINWSSIAQKNGRNYTLGQVGGGTAFSTGASEIAGNTGNLNPTSGRFSPISGTNSSAFGGVFSLAVQSNNFAAFFELLKTQGSLNVLSSPRVSTVNNQKAVIKVGTDAFFVTKQDITPSTTSGVPPTVTTELAPFFSGIALDVTPQIDDAGNINLHIHPSVSDVSDKQISIGTSQTISTALSSIQESDNIVRASSGQIIVIGGLMKEASTDNDASVPLLGDIPILGNLFKQKQVSRIKKELVILLKPTVIGTDKDWNDAASESQERVKKIRIGGS
jgi:MSHA biogenesis protein MshL